MAFHVNSVEQCGKFKSYGTLEFQNAQKIRTFSQMKLNAPNSACLSENIDLFFYVSVDAYGHIKMKVAICTFCEVFSRKVLIMSGDLMITTIIIRIRASDLVITTIIIMISVLVIAIIHTAIITLRPYLFWLADIELPWKNM